MKEIDSLKQKQYINFSNLPQICDKNHLNVCFCQKKIYNDLFRKCYKTEVTDVLSKQEDLKVEWTNNQKRSVVENGERVAKERAMDLTIKYCEDNNIRCPVEKDEVVKELNIFYNKYEDIWEDPRIQVVLGSLINFKLSALRMQNYSNKYGIVADEYDRDGNRRITLNPVEAEKRKYDESRIKAVEILDKMIEGSKVNVKFEGKEPLPIEDLYKLRIK